MVSDTRMDAIIHSSEACGHLLPVTYLIYFFDQADITENFWRLNTLAA